MPTSYTEKLYDGEPQTFPEFALRCARAIGYLSRMRDLDLDQPIPERFEPSDYYVRKIAEAKEQLVLIQAFTDKAAAIAAQLAYDNLENDRAATRAETSARKARFEAMRDQVLAWTPPSKEHERLRTFMLDQIATETFGDYFSEPPSIDGAVWRAQRIADLTADIARYMRHDLAERERVAAANEWLAALRESLKEPEAVA